VSPRDYTDYIGDILSAVDELTEFTANMTFEQFEKDRKTSNAVIRSIEVIGEAVKNLPDEVRTRQAATDELPSLRPALDQVRDSLSG
jgi:uncharacterized protein with HEPN domain